jgi:small nuclear ribonucleoprotein
MNVVLEADDAGVDADDATLGELDTESVEDTTIIRGDNVVTIKA